MQIVIDLTDLSEVPWEVWLTAAAVCWYVLAAAIVRWVLHFPDFVSGDGGLRLLTWAFSPCVLPVCLLGWLGKQFERRVLTPRRSRVAAPAFSKADWPLCVRCAAILPPLR